MSDVALLKTVPAFGSPIAALRERQPALAAVGLAFLALAVIAVGLQAADGRTLGGVSVWAKPAKFFLSTGVFILTSAWLFGLVRPERRTSPALRWSVRLLIAMACFELGYITFQAARGEASHFNVGDPLHFALYAMMGLAAVAMLATKIPLALEIARSPAVGLDPDMRRAAVTGIWMTVALGGLTGAYMGQNYATGHSVGAVGGAAPLFGWNRLGGDLRVAHFFGMHAEQALPIVAALATATLGKPWTGRLVLLAAAGIAGLTAFVFVQAASGRAFPFG